MIRHLYEKCKERWKWITSDIRLNGCYEDSILVHTVVDRQVMRL